MADDPKPPEGKEGTVTPPTPPTAAADKPASQPPVEPPGGFKAEVSRTDDRTGSGGPGAGRDTGNSGRPETRSSGSREAGGTCGGRSRRHPPPSRRRGEAHAPKAAAPVGPVEPPPPAGTASPAFIEALQTTTPGAVSAISYWVGDWTIVVPVARLLEVGRQLRDARDSTFDTLSDLTATDWPLRPERFDVDLLSLLDAPPAPRSGSRSR